MCHKRDYLHVCVYVFAKWVLHFQSVSVCTRMYACMTEEVEELGFKHTRSTSQRLGGPSPALMATHVNPTIQKMGQWNTTHSHS